MHYNPHLPLTRRKMLRRIGAGFGTLGLAGLMDQTGQIAASADTVRGAQTSPVTPKPTHFPAKAKHVIQLFMPGGPSHVDTFDYKPDIRKFAGQRPKLVDRRTLRNIRNGLMPSPYGFKQYGEGGKWVSDIFPHVAKQVDEICFIHSMHTDIPEHFSAILMMNLGHLQPNRPSLGAWMMYGLGSENVNLPGFIAMSPRCQPAGAMANYGNSFLPAAYGGTYVNIQKIEPHSVMRDLTSRNLSLRGQRRQADLLNLLNRLDLDEQGPDEPLESSIQMMELAFRMQMAVPEAFDLARETKATLDLYGNTEYAKGCLVARRLVERGVRMVQLSLTIDGYTVPWDTGHEDIAGGHAKLARACDQGIAALLVDLKQRGLLEETLVIWGGEFGRTPTSEGSKGRDHDHFGFTTWMAGGGVKPGFTYGATDRFGFAAVENRVHVHDLHATILHLMGLDHEKLTYHYSGRDFRLTDVHGVVLDDIIA